MDIRRNLGGSPLFASEQVFRKKPYENDDIQAIFKLLIWSILPDDIFVYCFCEPLLPTVLHEIRGRLAENDLINKWLHTKKHGARAMEKVLPQIKIELVTEELCEWLRKKFNINSIEDFELIRDYTQFSAFNFNQIGHCQ